MSSYRIEPLSRVDPAQRDAFFRRRFGEAKGAFLSQHGDWWHRGGEHRHGVLLADGRLAAYYATTPVRCNVAGQIVETLWWIDLMVDPAVRRQGLQTLMDDEVRNRPGLKLGIPNRFHSTILARHGWTVRGDQRNYLLPLRPRWLRPVQAASGWRGRALRTAAWLSGPAAFLWRRWRAAHRPATAREISHPTAAELAAIYERHRPGTFITIHRDVAFLEWRYLNAPYRDQLRFYLAGPADGPSHYLILRQVVAVRPTDGRSLRASRILDIYGDFGDPAGLRDIILLAVRDAIHSGAAQVTAMAAMPTVRRALRRAGFLLSIPVYFCCHTPDKALLAEFERGQLYWTLGDSDNDAPL